MWEVFCQLNNAKSGLAPITYSEIKSWSDLTGTVLNPYELSLLRRMENTFIEPTLKQMESKATAAEKARAKREAEAAMGKGRRG